MTMAIDFSDGALTVTDCHGTCTVLESASPQLHQIRNQQGVLTLALRAPSAAARHEVSLGHWAHGSKQRWLAAARCKLWWMTPEWGTQADVVPPETQMMLIEVEECRYVFLLPLVGAFFRSSIRSGPSNGQLQLVTESGDGAATDGGHAFLSQIDGVLLAAVGDDPYETIQRGYSSASQLPEAGFSLRRSKRSPQHLDMFGWCTWDAFMDKSQFRSLVTPKGVCDGVNGFAKGGVPVRRIIVDDGWQATGVDMGIEKASLQATSTMRAHWRRVADVAQRFFNKFVRHAPVGSACLGCWNGLTACFPETLQRSVVLMGSDQAKRLRSFAGNSTFEDESCDASLKNLVRRLKQDFGVKSVYAWHHLFGYWCGLEPLSEEFKDLGLHYQEVVVSKSTECVEPAERWCTLHCQTMRFGMPSDTEGATRLYNGLHGYLKDAGVDGVKVDGQSIAGQLGKGMHGGPAVSRVFIGALEASVQKHFFSGADMIACMCHANDALLNFNHTALCRVSDDFWPDDPASQSCHIGTCAYNTLFLSEIAIPDWDMFHSKHPSGEMHAAARSISGGPVYVSDPPGRHDFSLLKQLATVDGQLLLCDGPCRPTSDCLFCNPHKDCKTVLKLWNTNCSESLGVVALFNIQGSSWDRRRRGFTTHSGGPSVLEVHARPSDVEALRCTAGACAAYVRSKGGQVQILPSMDCSMKFVLACGSGAGCFEIVTFSPVLELVVGAINVRFAAIGMKNMMNPGGAIKSQSVTQEGEVELSCIGSGELGFFAHPMPKMCMLLQSGNGTATRLDVKRACQPESLSVSSAVTNVLQTVEIPDAWACSQWLLRLSW